MKPENRKQVRLILDMRREEAEKRIADAVKALHADHAAKGCLRSGATIKRHGAIITVEGQNFIKDTLDEIADVSQESEAYRMFCETFDIFTGTVGRAFSDNPVMDSLDRKISIDVKPTLLLASIIGQLEKQKELRRFSFVVPDREERPALAIRKLEQLATDSAAATPPTPPTPPKNKGGRPPAKFWDALWAEIAGQLYKGDFKPESQADITDAMQQWIEDKGYSAGDSTVAERARLLWLSIDSD